MAGWIFHGVSRNGLVEITLGKNLLQFALDGHSWTDSQIDQLRQQSTLQPKKITNKFYAIHNVFSPSHPSPDPLHYNINIHFHPLTISSTMLHLLLMLSGPSLHPACSSPIMSEALDELTDEPPIAGELPATIHEKRNPATIHKKRYPAASTSLLLYICLWCFSELIGLASATAIDHPHVQPDTPLLEKRKSIPHNVTHDLNQSTSALAVFLIPVLVLASGLFAGNSSFSC